MPGVMMQWQISITVRKGLHSLDSLTVCTEYVGYLSDKSYKYTVLGVEQRIFLVSHCQLCNVCSE